jgi:heterodisulfide reductase subunit C
MSGVFGEKESAVGADFQLWREVSEELADHWATFCYRCGACVLDCPAAKYGSGFNPRDIMFKARYGLAGKFLVKDSVLWQCFKCRTCKERCPQDVSPVDMITVLRQMLSELIHT